MINAADVVGARHPRCFLVYALAPAGVTAEEANLLLNQYVADPARGLSIYHDHLLGANGGVAVFFAETEAQREALQRERRPAYGDRGAEAETAQEVE